MWWHVLIITALRCGRQRDQESKAILLVLSSRPVGYGRSPLNTHTHPKSHNKNKKQAEEAPSTEDEAGSSLEFKASLV